MTDSITAENHSDKYYVTDITAAQQQPGDLGPSEELNPTNRQDHEMINIEKLLNDWLGEAV